MSENKDWLARLNQATTYRELQSAVSQMFADASSTNDETAISTAIDEVIRRIEHERLRDQAELDSNAADYDVFKQQQAGVLGWIKRKMPFTETRRQEVQHREAVDEQKAEVLADNFVIARAQMLKERLLPPRDRRMGVKLDEWQRRFLQNDSIDSIREYGGVLLELKKSMAVASRFIQDVETDVEAFAQASFADKADRSQRDSDLLVGRSELKSLRDELQNKESLRKSAIKRLSELVHEELLTRDGNFRMIFAHTNQLSEVSKQFPLTLKLVDNRLTECRTLLSKVKELQSIPQMLAKLQKDLVLLRRQNDECESRRAAANRELNNPGQQYEAASRNLEQTRVALNATKPMYDAYIAEQQGAVSASPVVAEFERLRLALAQAEGELKRLTPEFELAQRHFEAAKKEAAACARKLEENLQSTSDLNANQLKLETECRTARERLQWAKNDYLIAEQVHATCLQTLNWLAEFHQLKGVPDSNRSAFAKRAIGSHASDSNLELSDLNSEIDQLEKFTKSLRADQELIRSALSRQDAAKLAALQQRSVMLLDADVAAELRFE